jgi:hypothetical protein
LAQKGLSAQQYNGVGEQSHDPSQAESIEKNCLRPVATNGESSSSSFALAVIGRAIHRYNPEKPRIASVNLSCAIFYTIHASSWLRPQSLFTFTEADLEQAEQLIMDNDAAAVEEIVEGKKVFFSVNRPLHIVATNLGFHAGFSERYKR